MKEQFLVKHKENSKLHGESLTQRWSNFLTEFSSWTARPFCVRVCFR